ncbi:hypothetical protein OPT61_g4233 [Boeremia exigua]|uniref:Uncharacterized protein n=1 Tax=Boeremia exigua TaxID=749465 RepID=A0ACC2IER3_9PLEO|nr:hypothetical protein OPT61_g4233 [Boeremia exigua]
MQTGLPRGNKNAQRGIGAIPDPLFIESLEQIDVQRELQDAFLSVSEISGSSWEVERVQKFFREARTVSDANMWIDFRQKDTEARHHHSRWIASNQLAEAVIRQRTELSRDSLACRRLSFVPYASPRILEDLIKSATSIEIEALRRAACFPVFRLILNLPCLSLEEHDDNAPNIRPFVDNHNKTRWEDLSHLPLESKTGRLSNRFAIFETRTTVVLSGCSNTDWFGYAFGNIGPIDTSPSGQEQNDDDDTNDPDEPEPEEDFFATGGCEPVLNPENIIWDPRVYFLRAMEIRLSITTQASEFLVRKLDAGCHDWIPQVQDHESNQKALEKISGMTRVFRHLHEHYAQSIRAWNRFGGNGDALYFADLETHPVAREALSSIKKSFEKISDLEHRVELKRRDCTEATKILKVRIAQENNRISNRISLENIEMSRKLTDINREASRYSEKAAESALKSLAAAEETSRSSRVNVQLFMLTTAVVIALQYFCSERALFAFERSPRAFWISIAILIPSLLALSFALYIFDGVRDTFTKRLSGTLETVATPAEIPSASFP